MIKLVLPSSSMENTISSPKLHILVSSYRTLRKQICAETDQGLTLIIIIRNISNRVNIDGENRAVTPSTEPVIPTRCLNTVLGFNA